MASTDVRGVRYKFDSNTKAAYEAVIFSLFKGTNYSKGTNYNAVLLAVYEIIQDIKKAKDITDRIVEEVKYCAAYYIAKEVAAKEAVAREAARADYSDSVAVRVVSNDADVISVSCISDVAIDLEVAMDFVRSRFNINDFVNKEVGARQQLANPTIALVR